MPNAKYPFASNVAKKEPRKIVCDNGTNGNFHDRPCVACSQQLLNDKMHISVFSDA